MTAALDASELETAPTPTWPSTLWPGLMIVVAGAVQGDGALITTAYRGMSPVSEDQLSFPWHGATAITTSLIWGATQVLLVLGLIAFARHEVPHSRLGQTGGRLAVAGAALYGVAHLLSVIVHDANLDDPAAIVVLTCFGVGTIFGAIGLLLAGGAVLRHGTWTGSRRYTPVRRRTIRADGTAHERPLLARLVSVCAAEIAVGALILRGAPSARAASHALAPLELAYWIGFALPLGLALGLARVFMLAPRPSCSRVAARPARACRGRRTLWRG